MRLRPCPGAPGGPSSAGFTLIELLVAMALFALISLAGLSLIEAMVRLERGSSGRLERLADGQRALFLVAADFGQLVDGPDRSGAGIVFRRSSSDGEQAVLYRSDQAGLHRAVDGDDRLLLAGASHVAWRFVKHGAWTTVPRSMADAGRPAAAELTFELPGAGGGPQARMRRLVELPAEP